MTRGSRQRLARRAAVVALAAAAASHGSCKSVASVPTQCWQHIGSGSCFDGDAGANNEVELNNTPSSANPHAADCTETMTVHGSVGKGDVDFFRTAIPIPAGQTKAPRCASSGPTATLTTASPDVRLCMFAMCVVGKTGISGCGAGGTPTHLPEGMVGCCASPAPAQQPDGTYSSSVALEVNCDGDEQFGSFTTQSEKPTLIVVLELVRRLHGHLPALTTTPITPRRTCPPSRRRRSRSSRRGTPAPRGHRCPRRRARA